MDGERAEFPSRAGRLIARLWAVWLVVTSLAAWTTDGWHHGQAATGSRWQPAQLPMTDDKVIFYRIPARGRVPCGMAEVVREQWLPPHEVPPMSFAAISDLVLQGT